MKFSQKLLAKQLGVSPMTISRALRGGEGISETTRNQILAAARERGLATPASPRQRDANNRLQVLCTMAPAPTSGSDETPFHSRLLDGLRRGAKECASEIVNCPEVNVAWPLVVLRQQVDGAVMVWGDEHDPKPAQQCPVPATYIFYGPPHADVVTVDNFGGGFELGQYLAEQGHRQVAFIGPDSRVALERLAGLRAGLETGGGGVAPQFVLLKRGGASGGSPVIDELLALARAPLPFTAVMCYNDYTAVRLIDRLAAAGLRVPQDVSVVGFDGVVPNSYTGPQITSCAIPLEELGAEAARMVYWRLEHPSAVRRRLALETKFVEAASVTRIPR